MAVIDSWLDLWELEEPLDFEEFLESPLLEARRNQTKFRVVSSSVSASISFISSVSLAFHILRTHDGLSTTYHRLVMGLSIADIMSSFASALSSIMVPREMNYFVPYARGNAASCDAQGFLIMVGYCIGMMYNNCICCYYLSIIKYNKKDEYIKNKLEPWFHGVAVIYPLVFGFFILGFQGMNTSTTTGSPAGICFHELRNNPPHCIGREDGFLPANFTIPCGRGGGIGRPAYNIINFAPILISLVTIVSTMFIMYRAVLKTEEKVQRYGSRSLRISTRPGEIQRLSVRPGKSQRSSIFNKLKLRGSSQSARQPSLFSGPLSTSSAPNPSIVNHLDSIIVRNTNDTASEEEVDAEGVMDKIKSACNFIFLPSSCCRRREENIGPTRPTTMERQKRSILHMAFAYSMAWAFVWIPFISLSLFDSFPAEMFTAILTPLQGLNNLCVFLYPKARDIKSKNESTGWLQAFARALTSRGGRKRNSSLSSKNSRSFFSWSRGNRNCAGKKIRKPSSSQKSAARKKATMSNNMDRPQQQLNHSDIRVDIGEKIESQPNANEQLSSFHIKIDFPGEGNTKKPSSAGVVDEENPDGNVGASPCLRRVTFKLPPASGINADEHC